MGFGEWVCEDNVCGVFVVSDVGKMVFVGWCILLIDDVYMMGVIVLVVLWVLCKVGVSDIIVFVFLMVFLEFI